MRQAVHGSRGASGGAAPGVNWAFRALGAFCAKHTRANFEGAVDGLGGAQAAAPEGATPGSLPSSDLPAHAGLTKPEKRTQTAIEASAKLPRVMNMIG